MCWPALLPLMSIDLFIFLVRIVVFLFLSWKTCGFLWYPAYQGGPWKPWRNTRRGKRQWTLRRKSLAGQRSSTTWAWSSWARWWCPAAPARATPFGGARTTPTIWLLSASTGCRFGSGRNPATGQTVSRRPVLSNFLYIPNFFYQSPNRQLLIDKCKYPCYQILQCTLLLLKFESKSKPRSSSP